ncbi:hypothetical protein NKR19_g7298 [Coniochaeta hoffmannii]|uniref:Putative transcription factor kapC n=1 Tax=Coniochaeta hoffmannii TaxID=91930 RepID=A0AA38VMT4_9PEZI|nr:hypothetical protein NKR19_g7298 [Coniochaeta hoffmannii]
MEDLNNLLDFPSPTNTQYYVYGDPDQHLDSNTSESQSSANSPYDVSYMPDISNISSIYPSPERDDDEEEEEGGGKTSKPAAKRKRENRYKNAPPAVLSRRRAQNRASQRAYRERKDQRIKDLEALLSDAKQRNDVLSQAYATLQAEYVQLKALKRKEQQLDCLTRSAYAGADLLFDPTMGAMTGASNDRLDLDQFVYADLATGANNFTL